METCIDVWQADPIHLPRLIELGKTYYAPGHPALTEKFLRWFYLSNPAGQATLVVAHQEGVWIGLIVLIPVLLQACGHPQKACFAVNVLTHPEHRGKGLFVKMISRAVKFLASENIWLLGHPNANALPGWRRQGMHFQEPLKLRMAKLQRPFTGVRVTHIQSAAQLYELPAEFWHEARARGDVHLNYSPEFIAWRYLNAPHREYQVSAVFRREEFLGLRISRKFKGLVDLVIDYVSPLTDLHTVVGSTRRPTLLMHSGHGLGRAAIESGSWNLPLKRLFPFFVTRWFGEHQSFDMSGITLGSSDF